MGERIANNKICDKRGFSLAELLVALLITSFAGLIVMGGIGVTTRLFQDVLLHSQTQLVMKEYMSELRSGFLCAEMDSPVIVAEYNDNTAETSAATRDPVFAHSGFKCAGYYKLVPATGETSLQTISVDGENKTFGVIVFQPARYINVTAQGKVETQKEWEGMPAPNRLISSHLSDDFPASLEYRFDGETFTLWLTVYSNGVLSTGEHVVLSESALAITPTATTPTGN